jgi:hypothetical protein
MESTDGADGSRVSDRMQECRLLARYVSACDWIAVHRAGAGRGAVRVPALAADFVIVKSASCGRHGVPNAPVGCAKGDAESFEMNVALLNLKASRSTVHAGTALTRNRGRPCLQRRRQGSRLLYSHSATAEESYRRLCERTLDREWAVERKGPPAAGL